jgi:hypothetical protein
MPASLSLPESHIHLGTKNLGRIAPFSQADATAIKRTWSVKLAS